MRRRTKDRNVLFNVTNDVLSQTVVFADGHSYTHRCSREVYEAVACAIQDKGREGVTLGTLAKDLDVPFTQVNVALEFMKERGCLQTLIGGGRRSYSASTFLYEDAMTEFTFLAELPY